MKTAAKDTQTTTHFGYETVEVNEKAGKVAEVFHSVASKYDLMNDLMSLGLHRIWKRYAINVAGFRPGHYVLDLAGGTGDLSALISPIVGRNGRVVLSDINESMLSLGRDRMLDEGHGEQVKSALADAQQLPFADNSFDRAIISFGLRNVTDKDQALKEMYRVLKPGGCALVLEFSKPTTPLLRKIYDTYSFHLLPKLGQLVAGDAKSYQYLVESIRMHPDQETLRSMMASQGFEDCQVDNLTGGIVACHRGYKY
jgi:demethylmenaquinone methyltransferase/2-methoxy-6-polyprenyl-1,4-benzoquinol methylase